MFRSEASQKKGVNINEHIYLTKLLKLLPGKGVCKIIKKILNVRFNQKGVYNTILRVKNEQKVNSGNQAHY